MHRTRAVVVLVIVAVVVVALLYIALGFSRRTVTAAPSAGTSSTTPPVDARTQTAQEDALAASPMLTLPTADAFPQPLVTATAGPEIVLPQPRSQIVPGGPPVSTGFPHTREGALAQLVAIDEGAMSLPDLGQVDRVYKWAAKPGAVPESGWRPAGVVGGVVSHAGADVSRTQVTFQAVEGQIKGTVGADFVLACVLGEVDVTIDTIGRAGVGDCQRMVWSQRRWWIGPGSQPVDPPSAWPGSADAVRGGWRVLRHAS